MIRCKRVADADVADASVVGVAVVAVDSAVLNVAERHHELADACV